MLLRFAACASLFALLALVHPALRAAPHVAVGANHVCVITPSGGVRCMGRNGEGQLGDGSVVPRTLPTDTAASDDTGAPLQDVVLVAAGHHHSCAATAAGAVYCWGANSHGELGTGDTAPRTRPARVQFDHGTGTLAGLAVGEAHTCAVEQAGGRIDCWGANADGQLGDGTTTDRPLPVTVALAGNVLAIQVATGSAHSCALVQNGAVRAVQCWGGNAHGELGRDTSAQAAPFAPLPVAGLSPSLALLALGDHHSCSVDAAGTPVCWGANAWGQLGNGTTDDAFAPVAVKGVVGAVATLATGATTVASPRVRACSAGARTTRGSAASATSLGGARPGRVPRGRSSPATTWPPAGTAVAFFRARTPPFCAAGAATTSASSAMAWRASAPHRWR